MNKTLLGWLQIALGAFAAASSTGLIPFMNSQYNDIVIAVLAALTGTHAITSGAQVQNPNQTT